jgi:hypothetical protein
MLPFMFMETLVGVFRCFLPARYWQGMRRGALLSAVLTAALGVRIGLAGFLEAAHKAADEGAQLALRVGAPGGAGGTAGHDQTAAVQAALQGSVLVPFAFFLFTPMGWLADYLFLSAVFRAVTLAADDPWGDPILTGIDKLVRTRSVERRAKKEAADRERAEGPVVPDQILECRKFAGEEADYVVVSSRRKEAWCAATTVVAASVRLRVGEPREMTLEGWLRTCYPLKVIRDLQVDRRIVHYEWPTDMLPLPGPEAESRSDPEA